MANISYAASKHAIESYIRSAAAEIEVEIAMETPLGRVGAPEDVADVIVCLASEPARWLTGQLLYVGGGWRMHQYPNWILFYDPRQQLVPWQVMDVAP